MQLRFYIFLLGILGAVSLVSAQNNFTEWPRYSFKEYAASNAFPQMPKTESLELYHSYSRYASVSCYDEESEATYRLSIVHHAGIYERNPTQVFFKTVVRNWKDQEAHEFLRTDFMELNGRKVVRVISKHEEEGFSIWQISKEGANLYVHEVVSKTGDFDKTKVNFFAASLKVDDPGEPVYYQMQDTLAAIAYEMPAKPEQKRRTFDASHFGLSREIIVKSYLHADDYQHFNYVVLFRDNPAGIVYEAIDTTLYEYQKGYEKQFNRKAKKARRVLVEGYHSLELSFELAHTEVEMMIILRGNRAYVVMIEQLPNGSGLQERKERFYESIEFLPFSATDLVNFKIRDSLYIDLPNTPLQDTSAEYTFPYERTYSLYSLDTVSGISYTIDDYQLSPYFWTTNYDSLMRADFDSLLTVSKVITVADTIFQGGRAHYVVYQEEDTDIHLFELFFYRGPHYFNLIVIGNREYKESLAWDFFNSFRFDRPDYKDNFIAQEKKDLLWEAMEYRDSLPLARAKYALNNREIENSELPKVYDFLKRDMTWDTLTYPKMRNLMLGKLEHLKQAESIAFLEQLYLDSKADTAFQKQILESFLSFQTELALQTFFKHAKDFDPLNKQGNEYWHGFGRFSDTLELAAPFVKEWLSLTNHRSLRYYALNLVNDLMADSLVKAESVVPVMDQLIDEGNRIISDNDLLNQDTIILKGELYDLKKINAILARLPVNEKLFAFVKQQLAFREISFLRNAIVANIQLKHMPEDSILSKIYKTAPAEWYSILKAAQESDLLKSLPSEQYTQKALVKAYMHYVLEYDWEKIRKLEIVDQRPMSKNGDRYQVYIVKFEMEGYDLPQYGICTQPGEEGGLNFPPDFYDYTYTDEEKTEEDQIKYLLELFVEWEGQKD